MYRYGKPPDRLPRVLRDAYGPVSFSISVIHSYRCASPPKHPVLLMAPARCRDIMDRIIEHRFHYAIRLRGVVLGNIGR